MSKSNSIECRMKRYEGVSKNFLTRKVPVIIRIDGKAFHTFTKGMQKPFDRILMTAMQETMKYLCENIQGCVLGYTQSDEITLVLTDYKKITTDAWFEYNVQKITSIAASMATMAFNKFFSDEVNKNYTYFTTTESGCKFVDNIDEFDKQFNNYYSKIGNAMFDARCFNIPKEEVCNCLIWRQQDATRNSIESVGQAYFSHNELKYKKCDVVQDMLFIEFGINWNNYSTDCKRGSCCYKSPITKTVVNPKTNEEMEVVRNSWIIDTEIPIFTQDREFIERWL